MHHYVHESKDPLETVFDMLLIPVFWYNLLFTLIFCVMLNYIPQWCIVTDWGNNNVTSIPVFVDSDGKSFFTVIWDTLLSLFITTLSCTVLAGHFARIALFNGSCVPGMQHEDHNLQGCLGDTPPMEGGVSNLICSSKFFCMSSIRGTIIGLVAAPFILGFFLLGLVLMPRTERFDLETWLLAKTGFIIFYASCVFGISWYIELCLGLDEYYRDEQASYMARSQANERLLDLDSEMETISVIETSNGSTVSMLINV